MERNLLIVDDEAEIVMWLEEMFRYEFPIEIAVYTARSGRKALELLNRIQFDVVLTDIHMPQMDGITLFHCLKKNWPRCKTIFLTGYQNFDDVYSVFQHRDVRYVLKSERDGVIKGAVEAAFHEIDAELEEELKRKLQAEKIENANIWIKRTFFQKMLEGRRTEIILETLESAADFALDMKENLLVSLLRVDMQEKDGLEYQSRLEAVVRENLPMRLVCETYTHQPYLYVFLQPANREDTDWKSLYEVGRGTLEYTQEIFRKVYDLTFSAVIKEEPILITEFSGVAVRMQQIMVGYIGHRQELILKEESIEYEEQEDPHSNLISIIPTLKSYMELGKQQDYFELLSELMFSLRGKSYHDIYAMELYYSMATLLLQFINESHLYRQLAFKVGLYKLMKVDEHENWEEAARFLTDVSRAVFELLGDRESTLTEHALTRVIQYIDGHLGEDLTLRTLADVGGFNSSYLSRLFRQTCGQTVTDYICGKRMEWAKKLLEETEIRIQDISIRTGYISAQSFARAFRNSTGLSPAEYRELHRS